MSDNKAVKFPDLPWIEGRKTTVERVMDVMEPGKVYIPSIIAQLSGTNCRSVQRVLCDLVKEKRLDVGATIDPVSGRRVSAYRLKGNKRG